MHQSNRRDFLKLAGAGLMTMALPRILAQGPALKTLPNIVFVLCDDLGYGDIKCFNSEGKIATPNFDKLASQGMSFTDAHSSSAVCSPTRYSVLTGRYNWRSRLQKGVLQGFTPHLIEDGLMTTPALLKKQGYDTACFGKWHVGMDWPLKNGGVAKGIGDAANVDYSKAIEHGPNAIGFDTYYGIAASLDMPPFVFIENDKVTEVPTATKKWVRSGPAAPDFEAIDVLPAITGKAVEYIDKHGPKAADPKPFFMYVPFSSPHTPIVPIAEWQDKSGLNKYGDFVMQTDQSLGRIMEALERNGLADNTLLIVTSDNGCSPAANFDELLAKGHDPSYIFRGEKADIYEGGHHIPFIARWPKHVEAGSSCDQTICLVDFMATAAAVAGIEVPKDAGVDSVSLLPALSGTAKAPLREATVHHSIDGSFSIRQGDWKLELCPGSGGWSPPTPKEDTSKLPAIQLFNVKDDIKETKNVQADHPDVVEKLTKLLEKYVADGRSTPGPAQKNTVEVDIWKSGRMAHRAKSAADAVKEKVTE